MRLDKVGWGWIRLVEVELGWMGFSKVEKGDYIKLDTQSAGFSDIWIMKTWWLDDNLVWLLTNVLLLFCEVDECYGGYNLYFCKSVNFFSQAGANGREK